MAAQTTANIPPEIVFHVAPDGNDRWSGTRAAPNRGRTDGPLATVQAAQRAIRRIPHNARAGARIRVVLRGGRYALTQPLVFTPRDSGERHARGGARRAPVQPTVYEACPGETPILSGGRRITGWREETLNGRAAWTVRLPAVRRGRWYFRQLWVNGERRYRPRLPRQGEYQIARPLDARFKGSHRQTVQRGSWRFQYARGDINPQWRNLPDVELLFFTLWTGVRTRIRSVDARRRVVWMDRNSRRRLAHDFLREGAPYIVENVREALTEPGQWYLDRRTGNLTYLPLPGEDPESAEVIAPRLGDLLRLEGEPDGRSPVEGLEFRGLTFAHNEWDPPADYTCAEQAASLVPGAVTLRHARDCTFRDCAFVHLGTTAVDVAAGGSEIALQGCRLHDLGAGGVRIWHGCQRNRVADCDIGDGGIIYPSAVGVLIGKAGANQVVHNHIHDFTYSGVSVGWTWGYADCGGAYGNIVEWNHIHDLGKGRLSDMGGIYTLGAATGTRLRWNLIHDVNCRTYGGWAIYPDEGTSHMLIENNVCYDTNRAVFHQHYGRENIVRNNVFAFGATEQIARSLPETHRSFVFERNILYFDGACVMQTGYGGGNWTPANALFRHNLYWSRTARRLDFAGRTFRQWQKAGMDEGSRVADPRFVNADRRDFRLRPGSPALRLGFVPLDLAAVGPRRQPRRSRR